MSRLRIRNAANTKWLDICQSEWRVRNPSNTGWTRITPAQGMKVRHGAETYWLDIDCKAEGLASCDTEDEYGGTPDGKGSNGSGGGNGSGGETGGNGGNGGAGGNGTDPGSGSGGIGGGLNGPGSPWYNNGDKGSGQGGSGWQEGAPYPGGYDLPDSDGDGAGDKGSCIYRPGLGVCEEKGVLIIRPDMDCGTKIAGGFDCPFECPSAINGSGKGIWEFYLNMGKEGGAVRMPWMANAGAVSVDVYYRGKLIASTGGQRTGKGVLQFVFTPVNNDPLVFVRVRATKASKWTLQMKCVGDDDTDGEITDPRPCHGTFEVKKEGGLGTFEFYHAMSDKAGLVDIHYQMWNQPDKLEVFQDGRLLKSTGGYVAGEGHVKFDYSPTESQLVMVRITARDPGTSWIYLITCPGEKGSEDDPRPCSDQSAVTSGGAGVTDTFVDMGAVAGKVGVRYQMYNIPDKLDVYQGGTLVATTGGPVTGDHWLYFNYNPAGGQKIQIRVTGSGKTSWSFLHTCPGDEDPNISIDDPIVKEGKEGETAQLCWTVTMDKPQSMPVTVDYQSGGGTAKPFICQGRILANDEFNNPFIAVADCGVGRAAFDGGFPKFYNNAYKAPQDAPTGQAVFDSWWRTADAEYYSDPSTIPAASQANAWRLASGNVQSTTNSSKMISFCSPLSYMSYTFEATLSSGEADDDMIGLVAAFARVGSDNYHLLATRIPGGMPSFGSGNFNLTLLKNGSTIKVLNTKTFGGNGNWAGRGQTRVRVERDCNMMAVYCSTFGSTSIEESSKLEVDLSADPDLAMFTDKTSWGFCAQSQANATFSSVFVSGIGLPPAFTYLKNLIQWTARTNNRTGKVLITCDNATGGNYTLDSQPNGFGISLPGTVTAAGFTPVMKDVYAWNGQGAIPLSELVQYDTIIFMGSRVTATGVAAEGILTPGTVANFAEYAKRGGGLVVITDHYVFESGANQLANLFGMEFYGSVDRSAISVAAMIAAWGDHQAWDGLHCEKIPAGGSEGALRIKVEERDYQPTSGTVTFAPGETSKQVCVPVYGNDVQQPDRTVGMTIGNASKGNITKSGGFGTIMDDDSAICNQNPSEQVFERAGGPDGCNLLHVQPNFDCAAGNVMYLMQAFIPFTYSGSHVITVISDDDYELYIDCKKVGSGPIGTATLTVDIRAGTRNVILRYKNIPNCTPGYAGFSVRYNNQVQYLTKAADWKGQANSIGEIG